MKINIKKKNDITFESIATGDVFCYPVTNNFYLKLHLACHGSNYNAVNLSHPGVLSWFDLSDNVVPVKDVTISGAEV